MQQRSALETALKWLERADRSRVELEAFLTKKGFSKEETQQTVQKITEYGYLNDQFLANRVTNSLRQNLQGELKIQRKLEQRGLEPIDSLSDSTDRAIALLSKKFSHQKSSIEPKIWAKAARHLASQGYTEDEIESAVSSFFPNCEF
jgi:SOS response regulatory protein OraA/RecX